MSILCNVFLFVELIILFEFDRMNQEKQIKVVELLEISNCIAK